MLPNLEPSILKAVFDLSLAIASGASLAAWWIKDSQEEDDVILGACELITETLLDGDAVSRIEMATGRNVRDQITREQLEELQEQKRLLLMGKSRN